MTCPCAWDADNTDPTRQRAFRRWNSALVCRFGKIPRWRVGLVCRGSCPQSNQAQIPNSFFDNLAVGYSGPLSGPAGRSVLCAADDARPRAVPDASSVAAGLPLRGGPRPRANPGQKNHSLCALAPVSMGGKGRGSTDLSPFPVECSNLEGSPGVKPVSRSPTGRNSMLWMPAWPTSSHDLAAAAKNEGGSA